MSDDIRALSNLSVSIQINPIMIINQPFDIINSKTYNFMIMKNDIDDVCKGLTVEFLRVITYR